MKMAFLLISPKIVLKNLLIKKGGCFKYHPVIADKIEYYLVHRASICPALDFLSFCITSSYIVPFSCTYNGHQKSNCLLISSKLDVVKSLWNRLQSIVPDRIENGEKPCISKDFLVLCFTSRCRIGATPKRKAVGSNPAGSAIAAVSLLKK